jgi:uncharacterized DUF497 family protein
MQFEWSEEKRDANIAKHGVDFVQAVRVLQGQHVELPAREVDGEERWIAVGPVDPPDDRGWSGNLATVVYTLRNEVYRIISVRRARRYERRHYTREFGKPG